MNILQLLIALPCAIGLIVLLDLVVFMLIKKAVKIEYPEIQEPDYIQFNGFINNN